MRIQPSCLLTALLLTLLLPMLNGCRSFGPDNWNRIGRQAESRHGSSLALVKIQQEKAQDSQVLFQGMNFSMGPSRPPEYTGIILSTNGHVLIPDVLKADLQDRIEIWVGDTSYPARLVKADESLGMSILKIESDDAFQPLDWSGTADLERGDWALLLMPSGEETDFQRFITVLNCRGEIGGRYRRFAMQGMPRDARGALVVDRDANPVGLATMVDVWSLKDAKDDLGDFLAAATGALSATDEEKQKGWVGVFLEPINKNLAKARGLPESGLWVLNADPDAPGYQAGLRSGDLVIELNGEPLKFTGPRAKDYFMKALRPRPGTPFALTVIRAGERMAVNGVIAKRPEPVQLRAEDLGVLVQSINQSDVFIENLATREGVRVTELMRGSAAATGSSMGRTLLMAGDVITELDGQPVKDIESFSRALEKIRRNKSTTVLVTYKRGQMTGYAGLNLRIGEKGNGGRS